MSDKREAFMLCDAVVADFVDPRHVCHALHTGNDEHGAPYPRWMTIKVHELSSMQGSRFQSLPIWNMTCRTIQTQKAIELLPFRFITAESYMHEDSTVGEW